MFESLKETGRIGAGWTLQHMGFYQKLLPCNLPSPSGVKRRLQAYLMHYYDSAKTVEATLFIPKIGLKFACDLKDHMLNPYVLNMSPIYEQDEIDYCSRFVRAKDHIVDIGANHGFWGFSMARYAGRNSSLYLAEANPIILKRLKRTVQLNKTIKTEVLPYAIGDGKKEISDFYLPINNLSGLGSTILHTYAEKHGYLKEERHITVLSYSLDQLFGKGIIKGMDLLKVDVEHNEDSVISGALIALQSYSPRLVMVETSNNSYAFQTICDLGYQAYILDNQGQEVEVPDEYYWGNIFFRRKKG